MLILLALICALLNLTLVNTCDTNLCLCIAGNCSSCLYSQHYISAITCIPCPPTCATCTSASNCTQCLPNYYLMNSSCLQCPTFCANCQPNSSGFTCLSCINGYAIQAGSCVPCLATNAQTCLTPQNVLSCISGYWQNGDSCSPCRQFCLVCSSSANCLTCAPGYQVLVSSGSYCSPCSIGCMTCSSVCSKCFYNYQLVGGSCVDVSSQCSEIAKCYECTASSSALSCYSCFFPYYLNGNCTLGASLMCEQGAAGPNYYQCIGSCSSFAVSIQNVNGLLSCIPQTWLQDTGISQVYINPYLPQFGNSTILISNQSFIYQFKQQGIYNIISIMVELTPYYKLAIFYKIVVSNAELGTSSIIFNFTDNSSYRATQTYSAMINQSYQFIYPSLSTSKIKDLLVTIDICSINSQIPILAISQILIQAYACPSNCRLCYNAQLCMECYPAWFTTTNNLCASDCGGYIQMYWPIGNSSNYTMKSCVTECPQGFYTTIINSTSEYTCILCSGLCMTCISQSHCLSCPQPYLYYDIGLSCLTQCPQTHFASGSVCTPCNPPCATCSSSSQCLSCSIGFFYSGNCLGDCPVGTYQSTTNNSCLACSQRCSSCLGSPTFCLSCVTPYLYFQSNCLINCSSSNIYYQSNGTCLACPSPCLACTSPSVCLSCSTGFLLNSDCLLACPSGYYSDMVTALCQLCQNGCETCLSSFICLTCPSSKNLYGYNCISNCPSGTYSDTSICNNCLEPCLTCIDNTYCLTCALGYLSSLQQGTCLSSCENGYFGYSLNSTCLNCSSNCLTCQSTASSCTSCQPSLILQGNKCVNKCAGGSYNLSGICLPCSYPCLNCNYYSNNCTSCSSLLIYLNGTCITSCPSTYFFSSTTCLPCQPPCQTCSSGTQCITCLQNSSNQTYLYSKSCLTSCPSTTYEDNSSLTCRPCFFPCGQCLSQTVCLTCLSGYLSSLGSCEICGGSNVVNSLTNACVSCSSIIDYCQSCQSISVCTQCYYPYLLYQGYCISDSECFAILQFYSNTELGACSPCQSPCINCLNQTYCLSCSTGLYYQGTCYSICQNGFYQTNGTCQPCLPPCLTCSSPIYCLSCGSSSIYSVYFPTNNTCIKLDQCGSGYYLDYSFGYYQCIQCPLPCLTCSNTSYCITCTSGILFQGSCKFSCPDGYFVTINSHDQPECSACYPICLRCNGSPNYCTSCPSALYLINNTCASTCGEGYYLDQTIYECESCIYPCLNCSYISTCTSCINQSFILYFSQCLTSCPDGSYVSNDSCILCPLSCYLCAISNTTPICTKCANGLYMSSQIEGVCGQNCKATQYPDTISRKCYSCIKPCLACSSAISCLTCVSGYLYYQNQCIFATSCPSGSYLLNYSCIFDCGQLWGDSTQGVCGTTCPFPLLYTQINNQNVCLSNCPPSYFVSTNYTCSPCSNNFCDNLLEITLDLKSIFNNLYAIITFSQELNLNVLSPNDLSFFEQSQARLLMASSISFSINQVTLNALWVQLEVNQSLDNTQIRLVFSDYYLFGQTQIIQNLEISAIGSFDIYSAEEEAEGASYERFSEIISAVMLVIFLLNLLMNTGFQSYKIIDYYQLLFMVLFLSIDYPPHLNHFLFGFRFSHFLFLPQIFINQNDDYTAATPSKFGVIVSDVDFLKNTGPDFLILFVTLGTLLICKALQTFLNSIKKCGKSKHKIMNQAQIDERHDPLKEQSGKSSNQYEIRNKKIKRESNLGLSDHGSLEEQKNIQIYTNKLQQFVRAIIARFKWNYFNDIIYSVYFYLALAALAQLYDLSIKPGITIDVFSKIFAFVFLLFSVIFPFALVYLLSSNEDHIILKTFAKQKQEFEKKIKENHQCEQMSPQMMKSEKCGLQKLDSQKKSNIQSTSDKQAINEYEILTDYRCFIYTIKTKVRLGYYQVPIRYFKKLLLAILLVYCSDYPSLVLGVIMMTCFIDILIVVVLRPYRLTFDQIFYPLFDFLFFLIFAVICIMQLPILEFTQSQKLTASKIAIFLALILSSVLVLHNIVFNIFQIMRYFCKIDYLSKYYSTQYVSLSDQFSQGESEVRLKEHKTQLIEPSEVSSIGLDIYLKKESNAPPILIKCYNPKQPENMNEEQLRNSQLTKVIQLDQEISKQPTKDQRESEVQVPRGKQFFQLGFQTLNLEGSQIE